MSDDTDPRDDELLARILRDEADAVHPTPDWDDVRDRAQGRRRWWLPSAAAIVVLILVAAAVFALGDDDDDRGVIADDPGGTTLPEPSTTEHSFETTSTTLAEPTMEAGPEVEPLNLPAGEPLAENEIVAAIGVANDDGPDAVEVVVLANGDGAVKRVLDDGHSTAEGGVYGLTLTPDRRTVLYAVATSACTSRIVAAAVDGSAEPVVVRDDANRVAISPDGSSIAIDTGDECVSPPSIETVPLQGGQTTRYPALGPENHAVESMVFADEDTLLYVLSPSVPSDPWSGLGQLDLGSGTSTTFAEGTEYRSLSRHGERATALELDDSDGGPDVVILEGDRIVDRRPVGDVSAVHGAGLDVTGSIVAFVGDGDTRQLTIDGRPIRDDVLDVGF